MGAGACRSSAQHDESDHSALIRPWRIPNGYVEMELAEARCRVKAGTKVFVRCTAPQSLKLVEYFHFGVLLGRVDGSDDVCVAQLNHEGIVKVLPLTEFCGGKKLFASTRASGQQLPDMIARTMAHEGKTHYNMATCNCEHFASLCTENKFESLQVDSLMAKIESCLTGWYTDRQLDSSWQPRTAWRDFIGDHVALACNAELDAAKEYLIKATQRNRKAFFSKEIEGGSEEGRGSFVL